VGESAVVVTKPTEASSRQEEMEVGTQVGVDSGPTKDEIGSHQETEEVDDEEVPLRCSHSELADLMHEI